MIEIPARYARDPRIGHVGGHHVVIVGGARVYERTDRDGGPYEAIHAGNLSGHRHDTVFAALAELLGDPQLTTLAEAPVKAYPDTGERDQVLRFLRTVPSYAVPLAPLIEALDETLKETT